ncbi:MAG: hypothetical protein HY778_14275 [Betaproteobacteria bacterium]|nr:hypothetical protein [Betaproteobacteria bacterium]
MRPPIYLGDVVSGAGYRLAGARTQVPQPGREADALERARQDAPLVLVSAAVAARIPENALNDAVAARESLVLVLADLIGGTAAPDLASRLRQELGI